MENTAQLDQLVRVIIIFVIIFGTMFTIATLYALGWVIILMKRLYNRIMYRVLRHTKYIHNKRRYTIRSTAS